MHHFTSKVSVEKFQGDKHASLIPEYTLIDKTSIFAFDISTTCQYFKVLLFIVNTIDMRERKREIQTMILSFLLSYVLEKKLFRLFQIFRAPELLYSPGFKTMAR